MSRPITTLNIGKSVPSRLVLTLIQRGVAHGRFPWPETAWTRFLRELQAKGLTATARTPSEPAVQELPNGLTQAETEATASVAGLTT